MALIANSAPLISLARIAKLDLLPATYSEIVVPGAVHQEVTRDPQLPGAQELAAAAWLKTAEVTDTKAVDRLRFWLDQGESEAIVLAQSRGTALAIDERRGRRIAASMGIPTTGTVGILLACKRLGLLNEVTPLLDDLIAEGIRLSPALYDNARILAQES